MCETFARRVVIQQSRSRVSRAPQRYGSSSLLRTRSLPTSNMQTVGTKKEISLFVAHIYIYYPGPQLIERCGRVRTRCCLHAYTYRYIRRCRAVRYYCTYLGHAHVCVVLLGFRILSRPFSLLKRTPPVDPTTVYSSMLVLRYRFFLGYGIYMSQHKTRFQVTVLKYATHNDIYIYITLSSY